MIGRLHGRAAFGRLTRDGSRVRAGALWCTYVLDPSVSPPQVAFAIGRIVGPAVTRNKVRRRLRSLLQQHHQGLPAGLYLVGARPAVAALSFDELMSDLDRMLRKLALTPPPTSPPAVSTTTDLHGG